MIIEVGWRQTGGVGPAVGLGAGRQSQSRKLLEEVGIGSRGVEGK